MLQLLGSDECCSYRFNLQEGKFRIGRAADNDLILFHSTVSRLHAEIEVQPNSAVIIDDLGSHNGTFVGNRQVTSSTVLSVGENVRLGKVKLVLTESSVPVAVAHTMMELHRERDLAADVQRMLLNHAPESPDGYELTTYLEQCAAVGGDLYDVLRLPNGNTAFVIADVAGHGFGAALLMSHILASFRTHCLGADFELGRTMKTLSHLLWRYTDGNQFASIFIGQLEPGDGRIRFVNAGHPPPIVARTDGSMERLEATTPLIGIQEQFNQDEGRIELTSGDMMLVYTDGLVEADCDGEQYGEDRLLEVLFSIRHKPLKQIVDSILDDVDRFICEQPRSDDTALVAIRRK